MKASVTFHGLNEDCHENVHTLSEWVLFDVLSADGDVFEEALSGVGAALLHRVLGTQGEDGQVLQGQHQFDEGQVQLLSEDLTNLVALVLHAKRNQLSGVGT